MDAGRGKIWGHSCIGLPARQCFRCWADISDQTDPRLCPWGPHVEMAAMTAMMVTKGHLSSRSLGGLWLLSAACDTWSGAWHCPLQKSAVWGPPQLVPSIPLYCQQYRTGFQARLGILPPGGVGRHGLSCLDPSSLLMYLFMKIKSIAPACAKQRLF